MWRHRWGHSTDKSTLVKKVARDTPSMIYILLPDQSDVREASLIRNYLGSHRWRYCGGYSSTFHNSNPMPFCLEQMALPDSLKYSKILGLLPPNLRLRKASYTFTQSGLVRYTTYANNEVSFRMGEGGFGWYTERGY